MATHSSSLAWKIPWMEEPGRLQSMGSLRVEYDSATSLSLFTFKHWRRKWQSTPVFLPGESQGRGSLVSMGSYRIRHYIYTYNLYAECIMRNAGLDEAQSGICSACSPSSRSGKKTPRNNATCNRGIYY